MKFLQFLVATTIVSNIFAKPLKMKPLEDFVTYRDICLKENAMTQSDVGRSITTPEEIPTEHLCLLRCVMEKYHVFDDDDKFDIEHFTDFVRGRIVGEKFDELIKCVTAIEEIETCDDMEAVKICYDEIEED